MEGPSRRRDSIWASGAENEKLDWRRINDRRDPSLAVAQTLAHAPASWKDWVAEGHRAIFKFTRRIAKQRTVPRVDQRPLEASSEEKALQTIYEFYRGRKHRFEMLAAEVARRVLSPSGTAYRAGWVTPPSGDGGADFVGRLDIGSGFATTKVIVLGQAKCEALHAATSGKDIARTVSRLRRGWIGVYVTTSYFSDAAQQEVIEDQYPIVLVHGKRLAEEALQLAREGGNSTMVATWRSWTEGTTRPWHNGARRRSSFHDQK